MASRSFAFGAPTLHDLTVALAGAGSIDEVAAEIVDRGAGVVGASSTHLSVVLRPGWRRDFVGGALRATSGRGGPNPPTDRPIALDTPLSRALVTRREQVFESRAQYRATFPHLARELEGVAARTAITTPLKRADGEVIGALTFGFDEPGPVPPARRTASSQIAEIAALALDRAVLLHREREVAHRALRLHSAATELAGITDTAALAAVLRHAARDALHASRCVAYAVEPDGVLRLVAGPEDSTEHVAVDGHPLLHADAYPARITVGSVNPVRDAVVLSGAVVIESLEQFVSRYGSSSWPRDAALLALPLRVGTRVVGVILIAFDSPRRFSPEDRSLASGLAEQVAMALDRALLHERAESQSRLVERERDRLVAITSSMQDGLFTSTPDGVVLDANDRFCEIAGYPREVVVGARPPYPWWPNADEETVMRFIGELRQRTRLPQLAPQEIHLSFEHPDGRRIMGLLSASVLQDSSGDAIGAVVTVKDVTASVQAERRLRVLQAVTAALVASRTIEEVGRAAVETAVSALRAHTGAFFVRPEASAGIELVHARRRGTTDADSPWHDLLSIGTGVDEAMRTHEIVTASANDATQYEALSALGLRRAVWIPIAHAGESVACLFLGFAGERPIPAEELALFTAIGQQCGQSVERALVSDAEHRARLAAEKSAERTRRLQEATAALTIATEPLEVARVVTRHVGQLVHADGVALFALDDEAEELVLVDNGVIAATGAGSQVLRVPLDAPISLAVAIRTLEDIWIHDKDEWHARFPHGAKFLSEGYDALIVLPLVVDGRPLGVLAMVFRDPLQLDEDDRSLLYTLRDLAAHATARASRYANERTVARTLQQSLLPRLVEVTDRCRVGVRYEPAVDQLAVGGDWYDALALEPGRLAVMVGDVVGRGLNAAASMGQLRSALGALAVRKEQPGVVLEMLDRFAERIEGGEAATVAFAVIDTVCGSMRYACAGHPPPLLIAPGEAPRFLDGGRSWPLGIGVRDRPRCDAHVRLRPGSALVLYTDGLVERRREPLDKRLDALATAAAAGPLDDPTALCDRLVDGLLDEERGDDVAVLSLVYDPALADHATWTFPAEAPFVRDARELTRRWLGRRGIAESLTFDIVLACDEACANAVEHGNRDRLGEVWLDLQLDDHEGVVVTVTDDGSWRPPHGDRDRGHGLVLMKALMSSLDIDTADGGTTVRLTRAVDVAS
jgi:PAS domain S-box-containing protein